MTEASGFRDHFSRLSQTYAAFRPQYPPALFDFLAGMASSTERAWDCACGSGQATLALAERFDHVDATDASASQIQAARPHPRVTYRVARAEASGLPSDSVDLITVAQALHWFDLDAFYREAKRVLRRSGILAVWSYGMLRILDDAADELVQDFNRSIIGPYWPAERRLVDEGYRSLPFPFAELEVPVLQMRLQWSLPQLLGYLRSWSATGRYVERHGVDPVAGLEEPLARVWGEPAQEQSIVWPLTVRVGRAEPI